MAAWRNGSIVIPMCFTSPFVPEASTPTTAPPPLFKWVAGSRGCLRKCSATSEMYLFVEGTKGLRDCEDPRILGKLSYVIMKTCISKSKLLRRVLRFSGNFNVHMPSITFSDTGREDR